MAQELIRLENVSKYYVNGKNVVAGLNRVSLSLYQGEFVAITGESGSGKSTLGHILSGIIPYEDGELYFNGTPTSHFDGGDWENYRKDHISFISQNYGILPGTTVIDHVISALRLCGTEPRQARQEALAILEKVELADVAHRRAAKLSSGQKQRLSIARALAKPSPILVADEPTGNLDPENSEKVIRLLAQAAQERLVILITHEYSEAENYVTRHIQLQEGGVCLDAQLRPAAVCPPTEAPETHKQRLAPYIGAIQLRSRPTWCTTVALFFMLTAFAVLVFLGSFIVALDDTPTRIYDPAAFRNGAMDRIVVIRPDNQHLTQEDYDTILGIKYVEKLERFGYAADICYSYQEGVDYQFRTAMRNYGTAVDPMYIQHTTVEVFPSKQFVQTLPVLADGSSILTAGRKPEHYGEVVAVGGADQIGKTHTIYLKDFKNWNTSEYIKMEATVVGVTDQGSGLYFHEDVGRMLTVKYMNLFAEGATIMPVFTQIYSDLKYIDYFEHPNKQLFMTEFIPAEDAVLRPLGADDALFPYAAYMELTDRGSVSSSNMHRFLQGFYMGVGEQICHYAGVHDSTVTNVYGVSYENFLLFMDKLLPSCGDQVSLTIRDYAYTDRVIAALEKEGYLGLSPYVLGSAEIDKDLAEKRVQTLTVSMGALVAVILLQMIVLRALFAMENEAYQIFSSIGLPFKTARRSLWLQIGSFTLLGQLFGLGGMWLCSELGMKRILDVTKYLPLGYWLILCGTHILASLCAGWIVVYNMRKRVYPISSQKNDLLLDDEEEVSL